MSQRDYYSATVEARLNMLAAEEQASLADLAAVRAGGEPPESAASAVQQLANVRAERANLLSLHQEYVASLQPSYRYVSEEQRQARTPGELDAQDLADIMNQSRYSGKSFTADDYNRLRAGLGSYRVMRGTESK